MITSKDLFGNPTQTAHKEENMYYHPSVLPASCLTSNKLVSGPRSRLPDQPFSATLNFFPLGIDSGP
jgi:hypothetical protein